MNFEKKQRREHSEPQLASMIDVFSILIIFLIAGTTMDSSILNIPADLFLPQTNSKSASVNSPQVTIKNGILEINFINESINLAEIENDSPVSVKLKKINGKLNSYIAKIVDSDSNKSGEVQLLKSINLVAGKETPYKQLFLTMKFFRSHGFQNTILIGVENNAKQIN